MMVMNTPRSLDLDITNRCNLRCTYCSHFTSAGDVDQDIPTEAWLAFFSELNRCNVMSVCIQGGEPFYRKDLSVLIEGIIKNRMRFHVLSNGTLIRDNMAGFLASTNRCDGVQVSLDGSTPETHDTFRGSGSFSRAVEGIKCLKKHGITVSARVTIHKGNIHDIAETARLLLEDLDISSLSTNSASFLGLCRSNAEAIQIGIADRVRAMETLMLLAEKYDGRINASAGPLAEALQWSTMQHARSDGKKNLPGGGFLTGCNGPLSNLAVRADGVMIPCTQLSHIELGRINEDSLRDIWQNHPELKRLRERKTIPLHNFEFCNDCHCIPYCTGNCPALAYTMTGMENHPSPDACLRRFLEEGGTLPVEGLARLPEKADRSSGGQSIC